MIAAIGAGLVSLLTIGVFQNLNQKNLDRRAQALIEKVCDGGLKLSWQQRANMAAKANALNGKWERLLEGTLSTAAAGEVNNSLRNWENASGNDGLAFFYDSKKMYAQFVAECQRLP